jgi:polyhydroxyalkanoate synthase
MKKFNDKDFIKMFISVEKWLYDTPLIPRTLLKQIINDCYRNNLLIINKLKINCRDIKLDNVTVPLLTIVAEKDDLVSPE